MAEYGIMASPPGSDNDAGSDSTIRPTTDAAEAAAHAYATEQESNTLHIGTVLGDKMVLGGPVDYDESILMPLPGVPIGAPQQGGSYNPAGSSIMGNTDDGSNMGGRS